MSLLPQHHPPRRQNPASSSYVACHLYRPDALQQKAWGMWISFSRANNKGEESLVVGAIQHTTFDPLLQWARVTSSTPETSILNNQSYGCHLWRSYFSMLPEVSYPSQLTLMAGDVILSINGIPLSGFGGSMSSVLEYLKRCNQLFIVAVRDRSGTVLEQDMQRMVETAKQEQRLQDIQRLNNASIANSNFASHAWNPYPVASQSPQQSSVLRVVTPPKSETGAPTGAHRTQPSSFSHPPPKLVYKFASTTQKSLEYPAIARNPMFQAPNSDNSEPNAVPYCDNRDLYDPEEGNAADKYIVRVDGSNFQSWLADRKQKWRTKWHVKAHVVNTKAADIMASLSLTSAGWTNPMFTDQDDRNNDNGNESQVKLAYCDNLSFDPYDGSRSRQYLVRIDSSNFTAWLSARKQKWRKNWTPRYVQAEEETETEHQHSMKERTESSVRYDFWADQYSSFDEWLTTSKQKWKNSYSWNSRKRKRIQQVCEEVVHFPSSQDPAKLKKELNCWLRVRKNQWKMLRRKRQRRWEEEAVTKVVNVDSGTSVAQGSNTHQAIAASSGDFKHIDALLEEEERKTKSIAERRRSRKPEDVSFLFLPSLGLSDDLAALCLQYLDCSEHGRLLCISKSLGEGLQSRTYMWQLLCKRCPHWHLPRRPRKPWYKVYLSKLRTEVFASRKQWDDLLTKVAEVLFKGDQLKLVQKLVEQAEKTFSFTVDYVSGVVCERNSILNLAVIHKRHKVVHWLVEHKNADLETSDRGHFTPLINAAWGGDKHLVRLLLQHGADRSKVGTGHYTEALAPSDFAGLTAEGWARKKGHEAIADLIRVGL